VFDLEGKYATPQEECDAIATRRERQLGAAKIDMILQVRRALSMQQTIYAMDKSLAKQWEQSKDDARGIKLLKIWTDTQQVLGDVEADRLLSTIVAQAIALGPVSVQFDDADSTILLRDWCLREHIHKLRRLQKEIVERVRSLRYFQAIRALQNEHTVVKCCHTQQIVQPEHRALLSCCGHQGHIDVLREHAAQNACPSPGCQAPVRPTSIVLASDLGLNATVSSGTHGTKLTKLCNVLLSLPKDERILVFVQFPDLMDKVKVAIEDAGLNTDALKGSSAQKTKVLSAFQNESTGGSSNVRVLLLNLGDESASCANLTTANHLVFVHPLVAESQQKWTQQEAQAVGRVRRYGQNREVFVHRFIVDDSIDADIMAEKEQEFIGLVIDIDASVNQVTDDLLNVVRTFHEEHQEAQTMKYPL
jgi:SNF2 family DNA or RNA helicase